MEPMLDATREHFHLAGLIVMRTVVPAGFIALMLLVVWHAVYGVLVVLGAMALLGYATDIHVRRRDGRLPMGMMFENRITLDDGASLHELEGETAVRPRPTRLLGFRYAAAWSSRPEAVVRVAPPLARALAADLTGIAIGVTLLLGFVLLLARVL